jgi:hypothetical protein
MLCFNGSVMKLAAVALFALLAFCGSPLEAQSNQARPTELTQKQVQSVLLAVADEIYDYGHYKDFWGFETAGPRGPEAQFNVYIKPDLVPAIGGEMGQIIYRYLPYGEVVRRFIIDENNVVHLMGDPESGFGWTRPDMNTIYMQDEDVIEFKQRALKVQFSIDLEPGKAILTAAAARQKQRTGFSAWQSAHGPRQKKSGD